MKTSSQAQRKDQRWAEVCGCAESQMNDEWWHVGAQKSQMESFLIPRRLAKQYKPPCGDTQLVPTKYCPL